MYIMKIFTIGFILLLSFTPAAFADNTASVPEDAEKQLLINELLNKTGLLAELKTIELLRDEELIKLAASMGPISEVELASVKTRLIDTVQGGELLGQVVKYLSDEYFAADIERVLQKLRVPVLEKAKQIQMNMADSSVSEEVRDYFLRLKEKPPRASRVALIKQLIVAEQLNEFQILLKVEVRKSLLTAITNVKDNAIPSEKDLDKQMLGFRARLEGQLADRSLQRYLYLFKAVPSGELESIVASYQQSGLQSVSDSCKTKVRRAFSEARQATTAS